MRHYFSAFITSVILFFTPLIPIMISVGLMTIIDTYFGVKASKKKGIPFSSRLLRKGWVSKNISYQSCLILTFIIDNLIINEFVSIHFSMPFLTTKLLAIMLILIEFSSINESSQVLYKKSFSQIIKEQIKNIFNIKSELDKLK